MKVTDFKFSLADISDDLIIHIMCASCELHIKNQCKPEYLMEFKMANKCSHRKPKEDKSYKVW